MNIEIVQVGQVTKEQKGNSSYETLEVAYKTDNGRVQGKKLVSFQYPDVFKALSGAKQGDKFDIESVKEGQYWNWKSVASGAGVGVGGSVNQRPVQANTGSGGRVTGSNYETPVEREWNRTRIIRQSSLNAAISLVEANKNKASPDEVMLIAEKFETWVNRSNKAKPAAAGGVDVSADVPF